MSGRVGSQEHKAGTGSGALPRACVIGAGSSGIAAIKALADRGIPFDCFEKSDRVGGNWVLGNRNGMSSAYSTLHINTSRERMEYADFPMPASYPDFPRHDHIARYFGDYVEHFGLRERITFQTGVERATQRADGVWEVTLQGGERRLYDALLVANGHHWDPRWPEPPLEGSFAGELIHSHDYRDPSQLDGKRVVVIGMGNSAMDIAVDASYHASATTLVARSGVHVVPKYILGKPLDVGVRPTRIPFQWLLAGMQLVLRVTVGPMERYGLPNPDHRLGRAHPTVSTRILDRLAHGEIAVKRGIARLEGHDVLYTDGAREPVLRRALLRGAREPAGALQAHVRARPHRSVLHRLRATVGRDHADRRAPRPPRRRPSARRVRAALARGIAARHRAHAAPPRATLPRFQAPHAAGRLLKLRGRARGRAPRWSHARTGTGLRTGDRLHGADRRGPRPRLSV